MKTLRFFLIAQLLTFNCNLFAQGIHKACASGDLDKVKELLNSDSTLLESRGHLKYTPLHSACRAGQAKVANYLLDCGADVNSRDFHKNSGLHSACYNKNPDLTLVQRIIDLGADVNMREGDRSSPLHWAAYEGGIAVAKLLVENGANINAVGQNGITPLHRSAQVGNLEVAKYLIEQGADVNSFDNYRGKIFLWDISGSALTVANSFNTYNDKEELSILLVKSGANITTRDKHGNTQLHLAARNGYPEYTRLLVEKGIELNALNNNNRSALYYAAKLGYKSVADILIEAGANTKTVVATNYGQPLQLSKEIDSDEAYIWWFNNFSHAIKTKEHLLLLNPRSSHYSTSPEEGLVNGHLNPNELAGLKIISLISEPEKWLTNAIEPSLKLAKRLSAKGLVYSYNPGDPNLEDWDSSFYRFASANESFSIGDIRIHTIPALCGGKGYLIEVDGLKILQAGHHISDYKPKNIAEFRKEIDHLKPYGPIDIALLTVWSHRRGPFGRHNYELYNYLIEHLKPKSIYLTGNSDIEPYQECMKALTKNKIEILYPEDVRLKGERFHYQGNKTKN